jgi:hypothetical protein
MPNHYKTENEVEHPTGLAELYLQLDSAIIEAINHARTFCAEDVSLNLQIIFDEMRASRKFKLR